MELAMHFLQMAERQVGVDLRSGDVGVAQQQLHAAQVGAVLHHVRGAAVAQTVRAGGRVGHFNNMPDPLTSQRHPAQGKKKACRVLSQFLPCSVLTRSILFHRKSLAR